MWSNLPKKAVEEHYFSGTAGIFRDGHNGTKLTGRDGTHVWSRMSTVSEDHEFQLDVIDVASRSSLIRFENVSTLTTINDLASTASLASWWKDYFLPFLIVSLLFVVLPE